MAIGTQIRRSLALCITAATAFLLLSAPSASANRNANTAKEGKSSARIALASHRPAREGRRNCRVAPLKRQLMKLRAKRGKVNGAQRRKARAKQQRRLRLMRQRCRKAAKRSVTRSRHQPSPLYWGASIGSHLTGTQAPWDMNAVAQFEATAGKKLSLIHFFAPFANCASDCWYYDFPTTPMQSIRDHGAIPFFSWSSQSIPSNLNQPNFRLSTVIAGAHDSYLRKFAEAARDWGHPFFLRFNWEMNGNWFPWSEGVNGNGPGEYVAAWRHVRNVFASVGATNATWVWCPNIDPEDKFQDLGALYPGDAYVDWTCLDGYNWGKSPGAGSAGGSRSSFEDLFGPTYDRIVKTIAPSKPMVIGEVGATERDGSKAAWIADMLSRIPTEYPLIRGLAWFNTYDDGMDWPIETSAGAATAFAKGIKNPFYRVGVYSGLSASPIPPPS